MKENTMNIVKKIIAAIIGTGVIGILLKKKLSDSYYSQVFKNEREDDRHPCDNYNR